MDNFTWQLMVKYFVLTDDIPHYGGAGGFYADSSKRSI
jgi:hypothetical protein